MQGIDTRIVVNKETAQDPNLATRFSEEELARIGAVVWKGYDQDEYSRSVWKRRNQAGMDLALQVVKEKNFPWAGCSNIAFPLVTIATIQWHSLAYPQLVRDPRIVRYRTTAQDPTGKEWQRARRVEAHMSYQIFEEDRAWEEQMDRLLINLPIVGTAFKKVYYSGDVGGPTSELVLAQDLVVDYYAKSLDRAARKTQIIPLYRNDIYEKVGDGIFLDVLEDAWFKAPAVPKVDDQSAKRRRRTGQTPPENDLDTPFTTLEQHCLFDFDGDGYREPYIITIEANSKRVLRIVANWEGEEQVQRNARGEIRKITPTQYFQKYTFIPSPDGGIYDLGWGVLLGPLNESANTLLNQLVDAGTMATTSGGFLGRGIKVRGGQYSFAPLEWKRVDSTGDDIRKNVFPLPVREPSSVLFQLLSLLINYTQRISGSTDTIVGENPGQNTPASTTQSMIQQGMKIYNAIYKRVWRSMRGEFRLRYLVNANYLDNSSNAYGMGGQNISREDYLGNPDLIAPEADPNVSSPQQAQAKAMFLKQESMTTPGYDRTAVEKNLLRAFEIDGADVLYPGPDKVQPLPNPRVELEQIKLKGKQMEIQFQQQKFVLELQEEHQKNQAQILLWEAQAQKLLAEAGGVKAGHEIAAFEAAIGAAKTHNDAVMRQIETVMKMMERQDARGRDMEGMAGSSGNAGPQGIPAEGKAQPPGAMVGG